MHIVHTTSTKLLLASHIESILLLQLTTSLHAFAVGLLLGVVLMNSCHHILEQTNEGHAHIGFEGIFNHINPMLILDNDSNRRLAIQVPKDACHAPFDGIPVTGHGRITTLCIALAQEVERSSSVVILSCSGEGIQADTLVDEVG